MSDGRITPEVYTVVIMREPDNGVAWKEEWFDAEGLLHRVNGPALIERNVRTGRPVREEWYEHGSNTVLPESRPNLLTEPQPPFKTTMKRLFARPKKRSPEP
jgi:hypothetical protein